ncbi:MAG: hypothetical protein R6X19_03405 [Kiritimatiellia bacterium]
MSSKHRNWSKFTIPRAEGIDQDPCDVIVGFTSDDSQFLCRQIQRATDGVWGHTFVGFGWPDGSACYFEALLGDGVTGPWPIERVITWQRETPSHRLALIDLPRAWYPGHGLAPALWLATMAVGQQSYSAPQLLFMGLSERYGLPMWRTERRTVCSEYVAYVLQGVVDLTDRRRRKLDQVNPNSAWRRLAEEMAGLGYHTRPRPAAPGRAKDAPLIREAPSPALDGLRQMQRVSA